VISDFYESNDPNNSVKALYEVVDPKDRLQSHTLRHSYPRHIATLPWEIQNANFLPIRRNHKQIPFLIGCNFVIHPQILIFSVFKILPHTVSFGQRSNLLWTHTLRHFYSRPIALTQEGRSLVNDVCECVHD